MHFHEFPPFAKGHSFCVNLFASLEEAIFINHSDWFYSQRKKMLYESKFFPLRLAHIKKAKKKKCIHILLTLLHSERPKLYAILASLSAVELKVYGYL